MYRTNIAIVPLPAGGMDAYWAERLSKIRSPRTFDLESGVQGSWSSRNSTFPNLLTLEVAQLLQGRILSVDREADTGKEKLAESLVKDILAAYVPTTDKGFCLGEGAITLEPSANETAGLTLTDPSDSEVELEFDTQTVATPDVTTYSNLDEERAMVAASKGELRVLRQRSRLAGDLQGTEICTAVSFPKQKSGLRFTWHYPGVGGDSTLPSINIVGSAPPAKQAELEAIWESVMTTLRKVPLASVSGK